MTARVLLGLIRDPKIRFACLVTLAPVAGVAGLVTGWFGFLVLAMASLLVAVVTTPTALWSLTDAQFSRQFPGIELDSSSTETVESVDTDVSMETVSP